MFSLLDHRWIDETSLKVDVSSIYLMINRSCTDQFIDDASEDANQYMLFILVLFMIIDATAVGDDALRTV